MFDKKRFKSRIKWLIMGSLLMLWAVVRFNLLQVYIENEDSVSALLKTFILDHIIWWYLAPFVYGFLGFVVFIICIFKPQLD